MDDRTEIAARVMAALLADGNYSVEDAADEAVERTDALLDALAETDEGLDDNDPAYDQFLPEGHRWLEVGEEIRPGDRVIRQGFDDDAHVRWGGEKCQIEKFICRKIEETPVVVAAEEPVYRTLAVGEVIEEGDTFFCEATQTWFETGDAGRVVCDDPKELKYRRKVGLPSEVVLDPKLQHAKDRGVEPGEGYRLLTSNELLLPTDEFWFSTNKSWEGTFSANGKRFAGWSKDIYRRAVDLAPPTKPIGDSPGEGYRWLAQGEAIGSEDEFCSLPGSDFAPVPVAWFGKGAVCNNFIRRRVESAVVKMPPRYPLAGNHAQFTWNACCDATRAALDKAGVKWEVDSFENWLTMLGGEAGK
jgi:hypothetical protein